MSYFVFFCWLFMKAVVDQLHEPRLVKRANLSAVVYL